MFRSKLKEAIICFKAGRVTLPYPFEPHDPAEGFRGHIEVDVEKCIGCAACANACPARLIEVYDEGEIRILEFNFARCTYCARCVEVCPENALISTKKYETATDNTDDLIVRMKIYMGTCQRCGRCYSPKTPLEKLMATGFREATKK